MQPNLEAPALTALPSLDGKNKSNTSHHRMECIRGQDQNNYSDTETMCLVQVGPVPVFACCVFFQLLLKSKVSVFSRRRQRGADKYSLAREISDAQLRNIRCVAQKYQKYQIPSSEILEISDAQLRNFRNIRCTARV